jgi:adenosylcobinamide-phosphate synthase
MRRSTLWVAALGVDFALGEPPSALHPVVVAGRLISALERRAPVSPAFARPYGALLVAAPTALVVAIGRFVDGLRPPWLRLGLSLWLLSSSFAIRGLVLAALQTERQLAGADLAAAREELRALVSRPVESLDEAHICSAVVESLAENLSDSYVAPLMWYAVGGLPAALAYRVINTADAMVGYHGRYEHLGKAAARLDDLVNILPARISAAALALGAPLAGGSARRAIAVGWRDAPRTESPNAGWPMATTAGALGVWLEKPGAYRLGEGGGAPTAGDAARARRLVLAAAGLTTLAYLAMGRRGG